MSYVDNIKTYYRDLLIIQYRGKPRATADIETLAEQIAANGVAIAVQNGFDIDSAVGNQLDILGKYAGVQRIGRTFTGRVTLSDDDFRSLIKIAIVKNSSDSSLYEIDLLLQEFFPGTLKIRDFLGMRIGYLFDEEVGSRPLAEVFVQEGLIPKPMGVTLSSVIYSNNIDSFFGFTDYNSVEYQNTGLNTYADYNEDRPWLSYTNVL